jgi:hypothetical protein
MPQRLSADERKETRLGDLGVCPEKKKHKMV